jgi:predicted nucleic acid-binding protein
MDDTSPVFVDTNILVYAKLAKSPWHSSAVTALRTLTSQGVELWISRQVLREYLVAMSRPNTLSEDIPTSSLADDVSAFAGQFRVAEDGPEVTEQLLAHVVAANVRGKQIHDANIVATMRVYGIRRLLTHNVRDFTRFAESVSVMALDDI